MFELTLQIGIILLLILVGRIGITLSNIKLELQLARWRLDALETELIWKRTHETR